MNHYVMLQRNLIYTGITRAKKICVLIGTTKALAYAIHNVTVLKRNTKLKERINPILSDNKRVDSTTKNYELNRLQPMNKAAEDNIEYDKK